MSAAVGDRVVALERPVTRQLLSLTLLPLRCRSVVEVGWCGSRRPAAAVIWLDVTKKQTSGTLNRQYYEKKYNRSALPSPSRRACQERVANTRYAKTTGTMEASTFELLSSSR
eukprot:scaffold6323_cov203-Alexandrium_tamarense.AAC.28